MKKGLYSLFFISGMALGQGEWNHLFSPETPRNTELLIEKENGRSTSLFIQEQYHTLAIETIRKLGIQVITDSPIDSISLLGLFDTDDQAYALLILGYWKNGVSRELALSVNKQTLSKKEYLWLVPETASVAPGTRQVIYVESGGNFYTLSGPPNPDNDAEPGEKTYYSFLPETGSFALSE